MSKPSTLLERVYARCPFAPGTGRWKDWISQEMDKAQDNEEKLIAHQRKVQDENRRHQKALADLAAELKVLQGLCPHDQVHRGTAECAPVCGLCGAEV